MKENLSSYKKCKELLQDTSFLQWRFFPTDELQQYWEKQQTLHPLLELEIKKADEYLRKRYFNQHTLFSEEKNQLFNRIIQSVSEPPATKIRKIRSWIAYAAAACVLALLTIGVYRYINQTSALSDAQELIIGNTLPSENIQLITDNNSTAFEQNIDIVISESGIVQIKDEEGVDEEIASSTTSMNKLIIPYGKRSKIVLSDGTQVWLNSGSTLEFPAQFSAGNREIRLASGEMYIEVAPDKSRPFRVHTSDFNVKVYGTKFNVSSYSDAPQSVVLVEGSVSLQSGNSGEMFLSPNEQAIYSKNGTFNTQKVDVNQFISWKNGYLEFDNAPMSDVLKQIERYYNLSFSIKDTTAINKRTCSGKLFLSENVDDVMNTFARLSSTHYKRDGKNILITTTQKQ